MPQGVWIGRIQLQGLDARFLVLPVECQRSRLSFFEIASGQDQVGIRVFQQQFGQTAAGITVTAQDQESFLVHGFRTALISDQV